MKNYKSIFPNTATLINILFAYLAIFFIVLKNFELAAWFCLYSVLTDKLDGFLAKKFNVQSSFGTEFDSFADMISFCLVPALLIMFFIFHYFSDISIAYKTYIFSVTFIYLICGIVRLTKFNVNAAQNKNNNFFSGIPTTFSGALIITYFLVLIKYEKFVLIKNTIPILLLVFSLLMVSNLRIRKIVKYKSKFNYFQIINIILVYLFGALRIFPEYMLLVAYSYLIVSIIYSINYSEEKEESYQ